MGNCCAQDFRNGNGDIPEILKFNDDQYLATAKIRQESKPNETLDDEERKLQENIRYDDENSFDENDFSGKGSFQQQPMQFQILEVNSPNQSAILSENPNKPVKQDSLVKDEVIIQKQLTIKEEDPIMKARYLQKQKEEENQRMFEYYQSKEYQITKIQALQRGRLTRKYSDQVRKEEMIYLTKKQQVNAPISKAAKSFEQKVVINSILQKYIEEYGKFNPYKPDCKKNLRVQKLIKDKDIVTLQPYKFENHKGIYVGEWKGGLRHGIGKFILDNQIYEGFWEENYASGYGRTIFINGDMYEGEYFNDQAQGNGVYITKNKNKYEGQWLSNKPHGFGKESWCDGSKFVGTFSMGKKQGEGKFHFRDGSIYQGNFENNLFNGKGKYTWPDGREYDGLWKDNQMDGQGIFIWPDGRTYTGTYVKGRKDGNGLLTWPNGESYQGQWKFGHQHGVGFYTNNKAQTRKGTWKFGKFQRFI